MKKVAIIGAESTGKTTVAAALAQHYRTAWVPEYARAFLEARGGRRLLDYMVPIALGHLAAEAKALRNANRILFSDSCLLATALWSERYFGICDRAILDMVQAERYDLYILLAKDLPWVKNGLRDSQHYREWFEERLLGELRVKQVRYVIISGSMEERIIRAIEVIGRLLDE